MTLLMASKLAYGSETQRLNTRLSPSYIFVYNWQGWVRTQAVRQCSARKPFSFFSLPLSLSCQHFCEHRKRGKFKFTSGNEFKLTIAREWLYCYEDSPETGWRDCSIYSVAYCKVHVRCSSLICMLGKKECDVSEEGKGRNRKSENISELKKKRNEN